MDYYSTTYHQKVLISPIETLLMICNDI